MEKAAAIRFLHDCYLQLSLQTDLSPENPIVNKCLSALVTHLSAWQHRPDLRDIYECDDLAKIATNLPRLCAHAECAMEKWWCRRILSDSRPATQAIAAFWYMDNYIALCRAEAALIAGRSSNLVFLGCGALPLTGILYAVPRGDCSIDCVDCDGEACQLASELVKKLGLSGKIRIIEKEAESFAPCVSGTVICASLLATKDIWGHLARHNVRNAVIRDVEGTYRFLYAAARKPDRDYIEISQTSPSAAYINISRLYELTAVFK